MTFNLSTSHNRNASMDVLRLLACVMAIFNHTVADSQYILSLDSISWVIIEIFTSIGKVVPGVFFLLSGFFSHSLSMSKSIKKGIHYIGVFFVADAFYSALYIILNNDSFTLYNLLEGIWDFRYHLWFLTAYAGVTMISPILNKINENDLPYCAVLMIVFCILLPSLTFIFPNSYSVQGFVSILNGVISKTFVFIGYFLLGKLFRIHQQQVIKYKWPALILLIIFYSVSVFTTVSLSRKAGYVNEVGTDNNSILVFIECICLFTLFLSLDIKYGKVLSFLIPLTLDIYILHVAFVDILTHIGITSQFFGDGWSILIGIIFKAFLVFILSAVTSFFICILKAFVISNFRLRN